MNSGPLVVAKAVPFHYVEGKLLVALTSDQEKRTSKWSLPESPVYHLHTSLQSLEQTLRTQCGLIPQNVRYREQLYTFEYPSATPPGRDTICLTYLYLSPELLWHKGKKHIGLFPIDRLPKTSDIDQEIIAYALERLQSKALYTTLPALLLPRKFGLNSYQQVFETLTGHVVDKRNFRKKLLNLNILTPIRTKGETKQGDLRLYHLRHENLTVLSKSF